MFFLKVKKVTADTHNVTSKQLLSFMSCLSPPPTDAACKMLTSNEIHCTSITPTVSGGGESTQTLRQDGVQTMDMKLRGRQRYI